MTLCANPKCMRTMNNYVWPGGACSLACSRALDAMYDGHATDHSREFDEQARPDREAVARMLVAAEIDKRLPLAVLLRQRGWTMRRVCARVGCRESEMIALLAELRRQDVTP